MKAIKSFFLFILLIVGVCSCSPNEEKHPETIFVTFKNYDNTVLYHTKIEYGTKVEYLGEDPQKDATVEKVYSFKGWDKDINAKLYDNTIFNAVYNEEARKYLVKFLNFDGTLLAEVNVDYGSVAKYNGKTPVKNSDDDHIEYVFDGWDKNISTFSIKEDTVFTAKFKTINYVFASFYNFDDSFLSKTKIKKGEVPTYNGTTPTRKYDGDDKVYRFKGWDKPLSSIDSDTSYKAVFNLLNIYTVTFKNYDGSVLSTSKVVEGDTAIYTGSTPYKPSSQSGNNKYTYTFSGWDKNLNNVKSSFTTTAQFSSESTYYNETYQNALTKFKNFCSTKDSDGIYKGVIESWIESGYYSFLTACYDKEDNTCYLSYKLTPLSSSSSMETFIYFNPVKPGSYDVYFSYENPSNTPAFSGVAEISGYFSSSSSVYFTTVINYQDVSQSTCESSCANMIYLVLYYASLLDFFDGEALGFIYF